MRQQELADRVGCERSYVSALENDVKQAPGTAFVNHVCGALQLNDAEAEALRQACAKSRRKYSVPPHLPKEAYEVTFELFARLERLNALQFQGLMTVLRLGDLPPGSAQPSEGRVRRRDRRSHVEKEDAV
jgi:transcriptional regulator with XRE-family HTH domain